MKLCTTLNQRTFPDRVRCRRRTARELRESEYETSSTCNEPVELIAVNLYQNCSSGLRSVTSSAMPSGKLTC